MPFSGAVGAAPVGALAVGITGAPLLVPPLTQTVGGESGKLRYLIYDSVSGALLIDDLPHLHASKWDVVGYQPGATGRSAVGTFTLELFPPDHPEYLAAKPFYDLLAYGQRIEGYFGDVLGGKPRFTGMIHGITKSFTKFTVTGDDSLILLQLARSGKTEVFSGRTDQLVTFALRPYQPIFMDDFSQGLGNFTNDGGWAAATDHGLPALLAGASGDGILLTTASFSNAQYGDISVEALFDAACYPVAGSLAEASLVAAASDVNNLILGLTQIRYVSASQYAIDFYVYQKSGGTYTQQAVVQQAFTLPGNSIPFNLELKGTQLPALQSYLWRLLVNGADVGCFWLQPVAAGAPSGKVGIRSAKSNSLRANEIVYIAGAPTGLTFWSKGNIVQPGRISLGTQPISQVQPDSAMMDLLIQAASTEGNEFRKNSGIGLNQDSLDYGQTVGTDYSAMIRFERGNIVDASIEPNAEPAAATLQSPASPNLAGDGWVRWHNIAALKFFGPKSRSAPQLGISDILAHRRIIAQLSTLASNPGQAKRVIVKRQPDWADLPRELDVIELHLPEFNINHARAKIVGYSFSEALNTTEYLLDQYPRMLDRLPEVDRMMATVDALASGVTGVTATDPSKPFQVVRNAQATLPVNPWKMRVHLANPQTLTGGFTTTVAFDTVDWDNTNAWDPVNFVWVVPLDGYYDLKAKIHFQTGVQTWAWFQMAVVLQLTRNAAVIYSSQTNVFDGDGTANSVLNIALDAVITDSFSALKGDQISLLALEQNSAGASLNLVNSATYMAIQLVSG